MMKHIQSVGVVGAGAMGQGIAQIVAQAGKRVYLYDVQAQAAQKAVQALQAIWQRLADKGRMTAEQVLAATQAVTVADSLEQLYQVDLVVEAIVERLEVKQQLFVQLEQGVDDDCILASNTSSLSITSIAQACRLPARVVGFHFFNPVPLMKVVEVIEGLRTATHTADALMALARELGHTPVRAKDMPGFVVNHAGRGMNIEGLKVAQECVAPFYQIDAIMRDQAGFRMGPFELMDLTGLDVSHPVMTSIYEQFFDEPRFRPSPITAVRQAGKLWGRKTDAGFYTYDQAQKIIPPQPEVPPLTPQVPVWLAHYHQKGYERAAALLSALGVTVETGSSPSEEALILITPFGQDVASVVVEHQLDPVRTLALDTLFGLEPGKRRVLMCSVATGQNWRDQAWALLASDGTPVSVIEDSSGFVAQRIVATIINVAADIAQQQIATPTDIDNAVRLGLAYPYGGPLSMGDHWGADLILEILSNMYANTGDMRYRSSPWLRRRAQLGLSLCAETACAAQ